MHDFYDGLVSYVDSHNKGKAADKWEYYEYHIIPHYKNELTAPPLTLIFLRSIGFW